VTRYRLPRGGASEVRIGRATREHLFAAIMSESIDLLDRTARDLVAAPDPWDALVRWLRLYDESAALYRGMTMRVAEGIADDTSPVAAACAPMRASFGQLFDRARACGLRRRLRRSCRRRRRVLLWPR
jgi:hypothetical protein